MFYVYHSGGSPVGLTILGVILGAVVAILITILVENLRKPKLQLVIDPPNDVEYKEQRPAKNARFLTLELVNTPLPIWARWMSRNTALQCHGEVTFHHLDGQNVFGRAMTGRWSYSPEPAPISFRIDNKKIISFYDPSRLTTRIDISPGETNHINIAARFDADDKCYGWNNESYFSDPIWRNPAWCLNAGRYLVKVTIVSAGEKCVGTFRLINDVPYHDFRIEKHLPNDTVHD
jgi:hypothetical protein